MPLATEAPLLGLRALIEGASRSRGEVLAAQARSVRSLVTHAWRRVPYYRRLFERAGFHPNDFRTLDDLRRIPLTSKTDLRPLPATEIVARGANLGNLITRHTSGSTGEPLTIRRSVWEERLLLALRLQVLLRGGMRWRDRRAFVGLFPSGHSGAGSPFYTRLGLLHQREVHCLIPTAEIVAQLREENPDVLIGFPAVLSAARSCLGALGRTQRPANRCVDPQPPSRSRQYGCRQDGYHSSRRRSARPCV